jgi:hypothetical protein
MAVVFTVIFATVTFTLKSRTQVIPELLAEGMASDNAANLGAYALKYAIVRLQKADGSPKGTDTGEKIAENTVMEYGTSFEVISEGYINTISWDFVEATDYTYPNGNSSQEPQQNGNGWGQNRYRWRGGNHASITTTSSWDYALASTSLYLPFAKSGKGNGNGNSNSGGNNGNGNGNTGPGNQGNENPVGNAGGNGNGNGNNGNGNGNSGNGNGNNGNNNSNTTPGIPRGNHHAWAWAYGWGHNGHAPSGVSGESGDPYRIAHIVADVSWYTDGKLYTHQAEAVVEMRDGGIEGEIAYWPFDEGSGTAVSDASDIGNQDGLMTNMKNNDWVSGKNGTGLDFDGDNDYVQFGKDVDDNIDDELTVGVWAQAAEYPDDPFAYDWGRLVSSSHKNGTKPDWYLRSRVLDVVSHYQTPSGKDYTITEIKKVTYYFGVYNGRALFGLLPEFGQVEVTLDQKANPDLDIYDWHYIVGRYDGNYSSSKAEIMVKVVDEDLKETKVIDKWISHGNDNVVSVGGVKSPFSWLSFLNSVRCYDGVIDEVRLLSRAASEDEMVKMSNATGGSGGSGSSLDIVFWKD